MPYIIVVYDVKAKKTNKIYKLLSKYLNWIQNSVFEGQITRSNLVKLTYALKKNIDKKTDFILIYEFKARFYFEKTLIGKEKKKNSNII